MSNAAPQPPKDKMTFRRVLRAARLASEGIHPYDTSIPHDRMKIALHALVMIQVNSGHFTKHKTWAFEALQALRPDLALLPPLIAMERVREGRTQPEIAGGK
jgi:hypothetical protein